jgi:hypothetical protein
MNGLRPFQLSFKHLSPIREGEIEMQEVATTVSLAMLDIGASITINCFEFSSNMRRDFHTSFRLKRLKNRKAEFVPNTGKH